ncbi:hypothetical protein VPH35_056455 [Triticum aestivum]
MRKIQHHMLQQSVDRLAAPAAAGGGTSVLTDTLLILAAVLCFMIRMAGLAMVAQCSRLCNPSVFFVDASGQQQHRVRGSRRRRCSRCPRTSASGGVRERRGGVCAPVLGQMTLPRHHRLSRP